jgi:hypothetical protein
MRFRYQPVETLPPLAWCARLSQGEAEILVIHGSGVVTRPEGFVEGVWDAPWEAFNFDEAATLAGSGGKIRGDGVIFCAASDKFSWLQSLRAGDVLWLSNSLVFLLVQAGDEPDRAYPWYLFDFVRAHRWGLRKPVSTIRTRQGRRVGLHRFCNLAVDAGLDIQREEKARPPRPLDFASHTHTMRDTLRRLFENGGDPARPAPFRPVSTLSRGYDSPAVSVLAAQAGCREAVCIVNTYQGRESAASYSVLGEDNGTEIGVRLGMTVHEIKRDDFTRLPGTPEAEFCIGGGMGSSATFAPLAGVLAGAILLLGFSGDAVWSVDPACNLPDLLAPDILAITGEAFNEFRLRVGCVTYSVPQIGGLHREDVFRISHSAEMKPWWVEGDYNRPIPRRIIEEAGVPRGTFAMHKTAGAHNPVRREDGMKRESRQDFFRFVAGSVPGGARGSRFRLGDAPYLLLDALYAFSKRYPGRDHRFYKWLLPLTMKSDRRRSDPRCHVRLRYLFHWGFERIRERYPPPVE